MGSQLSKKIRFILKYVNKPYWGSDFNDFDELVEINFKHQSHTLHNEVPIFVDYQR